MQVSRDYALAELKSIRDTLEEWIDTLENPVLSDAHTGQTVPAYSGEVPSGVSVAEMDGVPSDQLKAELMAVAGRLESLAVT